MHEDKLYPMRGHWKILICYNIINNNISIYQDMIDPLQHTIDIDNINYNLISLRWKISKLSYNKIPVCIELHVVHQNFNSLHKLTIIIPLDFKNIESFKNINYVKMTKNYSIFTDSFENNNENVKFSESLYFQKDKKNNLLIKSLKNTFDLNKEYKDNKFSLNTLIPSEVLIPQYECCRDSIGQKLRFNLCDLQQILLNNNKIYAQLEDRDGNSYLISDPQLFDENIGLNLFTKIKNDDLVVFMKPI